MKARVGDARYAAMIARAPVSARDVLENAMSASWYPIAALDTLLNLYSRERGFRGTMDARDEFEALGRYVAEDNLTGIYRALLRVLSAHGAVPMMPRMWSQYFKEQRCQLEWDRTRTEARLTVAGLPIAHLGAVAAGWQQAALRLSTHPGATVVEERYARGQMTSDPMVFRIVW